MSNEKKEDLKEEFSAAARACAKSALDFNRTWASKQEDLDYTFERFADWIDANFTEKP